VGRVAVVAATAAGRRLARDLAGQLGADLPPGRPADAVAGCWRDTDALVLVMATGAAVRLVAGHLGHKRTDPAVVCVDDAGRFAVALTGAHERGGNALARRIAGFLSATPVVTTASEAAGLPGLQALGGRFGVRAEGDLAVVGGHVLGGGAVRLRRDLAWPLGPVPAPVTDDPAAPLLLLTDRAPAADRAVAAGGPVVRFHPPSLVVGVGSARGVSAAEVAALVDAALREAGLAPASVAMLATVDLKADECGINQAAAQRGWPVRHLPAERLATVGVPHPSEVVRAAVGTPSVAEAAALHLGGELLVPKRRSAMATVAVARRPARGRLALLSLGPGAADLVPPRVREELAAAEVVVGYGPYVDVAAPWTGRGVVLERYPLGAEVERADRALALARTGRAVALVGSGDVGIYAMASPTLERADGRVDVVVVPGVTAALAASALLGAPLGHDHCVLSLSDLLTPWELIEARVAAAARTDLVVVFYNPRSRRRDWQLARAVEILRGHRGGDTPVGVVHDAERPGQQVIQTTLDALDVEAVHMTSVVLVGSSRTRQVAGRIVTPRGYPDGRL
jgi:cobalt-precorrin 5A hydrolase/precorrin-3B C17-methyltransferase